MTINSGANPRKLLQVNIFKKMNSMAPLCADLLVGITLKIQVKCYEQILLVRFTRDIQVINSSKYFIELAPGHF